MYTKLELEVMGHKELYYKGKPTISDKEFDLLEAQLPLNSKVRSAVGFELLDRTKEKHAIPMGSLKKAMSASDLKEYSNKFFDNYMGQIVVMPKYDGSSIAITVKNGKLFKALTRGNGVEGMNVTAKLLKAFQILKDTNKLAKDDGEFRAEVIITNVNWDKMQIEYVDKGYKAQRNAAAGILNGSYDETSNIYELLTIKPFYKNNDIIGISDASSFRGVDYLDYDVLAKLHKTYNEDFLADGVVLYTDGYAPSKVDKNLFPLDTFAVKFNAIGVEVDVDHIEWDVSRLGKVKPVVILKKPIDLDGATIQRATGHNYQYICENAVGKKSTISIIRSGGVIPYIVDVIKGTSPDVPFVCPSCGELLIIDGVNLQCTNSECKQMNIKKITYFFKAMGLEEFSESSFAQIYDTGFTRITDYYAKLETLRDTLHNLEGWQKTKIDKLYYGIINLTKCTEVQLLRSISINGFGDELLKLVLTQYKIFDLFSSSLPIDENRLNSLEGFSTIRTQNLIDEITNARSMFYTIAPFLEIKREEFRVASILEGLTFCITGKTSLFPRKDFVAYIKKNGGKHSATKFDYLITNEDKPTAKRKKAEASGAKIINEAAFQKLFEELS